LFFRFVKLQKEDRGTVAVFLVNRGLVGRLGYGCCKIEATIAVVSTSGKENKSQTLKDRTANIGAPIPFSKLGISAKDIIKFTHDDGALKVLVHVRVM
jgi:hypothetical protein